MRGCFTDLCRRGFTIIELLVVLGVLAVLTSLLLPALSGVRENAEQVRCRSQLRQLGQLTASVMAQEDGKLPYALSAPSQSPGGLAVEFVDYYAELAGGGDLLLCPADPLANRRGVSGVYSSYSYWPGEIMLLFEIGRDSLDPRGVTTRLFRDFPHERWPVFVERSSWYGEGSRRLACYFGDWHVDWFEAPEMFLDDED